MLTYGTETWAMNVENLHSLEKAERMKVRWMCGVSLKDRQRNGDLYSYLSIQNLVEVVRCGRLRWEKKEGSNFVVLFFSVNQSSSYGENEQKSDSDSDKAVSCEYSFGNEEWDSKTTQDYVVSSDDDEN